MKRHAIDTILGHQWPSDFRRPLHSRAGSSSLSACLFLDLRPQRSSWRAILAVCNKETSPSEFAKAASAESCLARLMRAQDLSEPELICKADFRRRVLYCFVAFGLTLIAQFKPDAPAVLMPLAQALLLVSIGMIIGSLARYRILRTMDIAESSLKEQGLLK